MVTAAGRVGLADRMVTVNLNFYVQFIVQKQNTRQLTPLVCETHKLFWLCQANLTPVFERSE